PYLPLWRAADAGGRALRWLGGYFQRIIHRRTGQLWVLGVCALSLRVYYFIFLLPSFFFLFGFSFLLFF
ncbi:hypothetical protein ACEN8K_45425, partial [Variovorax sp. CT11-76]